MAAIHHPPSPHYGYPHTKHGSNASAVTPFDAVFVWDGNVEHTPKKQSFEFADFILDEVESEVLTLQNRSLPTLSTGTYYAAHHAQYIYAGEKVTDLSSPVFNPVTNAYDPLPDVTPYGAYTVPAGSSLKLRAGTSITLKPGFSAKSGAVFSAKLVAYEDCSTNHNRPAVAIEENEIPENGAEVEAGIKVFPNPTTGQFTVQTPTAIVAWNLIDLTGKVQMSQAGINQTELQLSLEAPAGIYLLHLTDLEGSVSTHKIIKQ